VTLVAEFSDGQRTLVMPVTDQQGRSELTLTFTEQDPGSTVTFEVWVVYGEAQTSRRDSFLVWW
jgi:hypothetical protein